MQEKYPGLTDSCISRSGMISSESDHGVRTDDRTGSDEAQLKGQKLGEQCF